MLLEPASLCVAWLAQDAPHALPTSSPSGAATVVVVNVPPCGGCSLANKALAALPLKHLIPRRLAETVEPLQHWVVRLLAGFTPRPHVVALAPVEGRNRKRLFAFRALLRRLHLASLADHVQGGGFRRTPGRTVSPPECPGSPNTRRLGFLAGCLCRGTLPPTDRLSATRLAAPKSSPSSCRMIDIASPFTLHPMQLKPSRSKLIAALAFDSP